jgi:hypothetical protein
MQGIRVSQLRIMTSIQRIDPEGNIIFYLYFNSQFLTFCDAMHATLGPQSRINNMRVRGIYHKVAPHHVWHVDGTHKLIDPYGLVIHVGIDGFSRCCTFCVCSDNNLS